MNYAIKRKSFKDTNPKEYLSEIDAQIAELTQKAEVDNADLDERKRFLHKLINLKKNATKLLKKF
jgi:hypothetical protein